MDNTTLTDEVTDRLADAVAADDPNAALTNLLFQLTLQTNRVNLVLAKAGGTFGPSAAADDDEQDAEDDDSDHIYDPYEFADGH